MISFVGSLQVFACIYWSGVACQAWAETEANLQRGLVQFAIRRSTRNDRSRTIRVGWLFMYTYALWWWLVLRTEPLLQVAKIWKLKLIESMIECYLAILKHTWAALVTPSHPSQEWRWDDEQHQGLGEGFACRTAPRVAPAAIVQSLQKAQVRRVPSQSQV